MPHGSPQPGAHKGITPPMPQWDEQKNNAQRAISQSSGRAKFCKSPTPLHNPVARRMQPDDLHSRNRECTCCCAPQGPNWAWCTHRSHGPRCIGLTTEAVRGWCQATQPPDPAYHSAQICAGTQGRPSGSCVLHTKWTCAMCSTTSKRSKSNAWHTCCQPHGRSKNNND